MKSDKEFVKSPGEWPRWPLLPLKRGLQNEETGVVTPDYPSTVLLVNVWSVNATNLVINQLSNKGKVLLHDGEFLPFKEYETIDDMLNDGWRID